MPPLSVWSEEAVKYNVFKPKRLVLTQTEILFTQQDLA
jgi:hypothetical protein